MQFEDIEVSSRISSSLNEEQDASSLSFQFLQMEELADKLKLLNFEDEFIRAFKIRPMNRHYFALRTNSGEQYFNFVSLASWLLRKCDKDIDPPQEYDDPNSTIAVILEQAKNLDITVDFPPNKLKQGCGRYVIVILNELSDKALENIRFNYLKPIPPVEIDEEEPMLEDDSELLLERIEEEMAADYLDSEEDEDVHLPVDDLNRLSITMQKFEETPTVTNEEWQLEVERVLPYLKMTIKTDGRDWRSHLCQIKEYRATIEDTSQMAKTHLSKVSEDIAQTMEKINSREKLLNTNLDHVLGEYRTVQDQLSKINERYQEVNSGVLERQRRLAQLNEELDQVKREMGERGTLMTDGTPLINIKKSLATLKQDANNLNVKIGVLQHDILHAQLKEKLMLQQKLQSHVYA